jgi:hypothetical protein
MCNDWKKRGEFVSVSFHLAILGVELKTLSLQEVDYVDTGGGWRFTLD